MCVCGESARQPASQLRLQRRRQTLVLSNAWHTHAHTHPPTVRKSCVRDETSGKVRRCSGAFLEMPLSIAVLLALDWPFLTWLPNVCRCRLQAVCRGTDFCVASGGAGRGVAAFRHPAAGRSHGRLGRYREPKSKDSQQRGDFVQLCKVQNASFPPFSASLLWRSIHPTPSLFVFTVHPPLLLLLPLPPFPISLPCCAPPCQPPWRVTRTL